MRGIDKRLTSGCDLVQTVLIDQTLSPYIGVVDFAPFGKIHSGPGSTKRRDNIARYAVHKCEDILSSEHLLAECVQLLKLTSSAVGAQSLAACSLRKLTGDHSSE